MEADRDITRVCVFGGSGFLGTEIVHRLADAGIALRVAVRRPDRVHIPENSGTDGRITPVYADIRDETSVALAMEGCDAVVNAVGLYTENGAETFEAVHELGAVNVAHQSELIGAKRLVHLSGIGADLCSVSKYVRARAKGDLLVRDICPQATILRPSVVFGPQDLFINTLAEMIQRAPALPLFGRGETKLQPVFVADVAEATHRVLTLRAALGQTYELGGPDIYSYRALIELVLRRTGRRRLLVPVPFWAWDGLAALAAVLPRPPLTKAQVTLMKRDNVVAATAPGFGDLGIRPAALANILQDYKF